MLWKSKKALLFESGRALFSIAQQKSSPSDNMMSINSPTLKNILMEHCEPYRLSDFMIVKELGKGAFGTTFLASRNLDPVEVCLKEIPLTNGVSPQEIEREAKMLSELNYKHIIRYYGSFVESGKFYIVMEYAAEGNLAEMIAV